MTKIQLPIKITTLFVGFCFFLFSCQKDETTPDPQPNNPSNPTSPYFKWQIDQGSVVTADSAYAYAQSFVIFAIKNSGQNVEVNLSSMNTGTYNISSSTGNQLKYVDSSNDHEGAGVFIITTSTTNKMSGNFSCSFSGSNLSTITGTFSDIPKR